MSNHSGSYLLNEVITKLDRFQVFEMLDNAKSQALVMEIATLGCRDYDCNRGEILEGHEAQFQLCRYCFYPAEDLEDGLCPTCKKALEDYARER